MKKFYFILFSIILSISASAQYQINNKRFNAIDNELSNQLLLDLSKSRIGLHLLGWGAFNNGNPSKMNGASNKDETWGLSYGGMVHMNTADGDFIYDANISNGYVHLTRQVKVDKSLNPISVKTYKGWIKIIGVGKDQLILTLDDRGYYRIFKTIVL